MNDNADFNQIVDETVNFFMSKASRMRPEEVFEMAMAVYMNLMAILPYPITKAAHEGGTFSNEYRDLVMSMMPEFTVNLRGYTAEFIQKFINAAIEKGLVREGQFEFLGKTYPMIPEPPTDATN